MASHNDRSHWITHLLEGRVVSHERLDEFRVVHDRLHKGIVQSIHTFRHLSITKTVISLASVDSRDVCITPVLPLDWQKDWTEEWRVVQEVEMSL